MRSTGTLRVVVGLVMQSDCLTPLQAWPLPELIQIISRKCQVQNVVFVLGSRANLSGQSVLVYATIIQTQPNKIWSHWRLQLLKTKTKTPISLLLEIRLSSNVCWKQYSLCTKIEDKLSSALGRQTQVETLILYRVSVWPGKVWFPHKHINPHLPC